MSPYRITHSSFVQVISPTAHHLDGTLEYNVHNLYGHSSAMATWRALTNIYPERRPFLLTRYNRHRHCDIAAANC